MMLPSLSFQPNWMTERYSAASCVYNARIKTKVFDEGERRHTERLVHFPQRDLLFGHAGAREQRFHRVDWSQSEVDWCAFKN